MPADLQRKQGKENVFSQDNATHWMEKNVVGKNIEFNAKIRTASISGHDKYSIDLALESDQDNVVLVEIGSVKLGAVTWPVALWRRPTHWDNLDAKSAKRLLNLKAKTAKFSGIIKLTPRSNPVAFSGSPVFTSDHLLLDLSNHTVNGIDPSKEK